MLTTLPTVASLAGMNVTPDKSERPERRIENKNQASPQRDEQTPKPAAILEDFYAKRRLHFRAEGFWRHDGTPNG
jgi:hypothetical protein